MKKKADILIVDDEQVVIDAVTKICSSLGLSVDASTDAHSGLEKIRSSDYRLVICDVRLPEMDAFQFLKRVTEAHVSVPAILITGYSTAENAVKSLNSGATAYVAKPFTENELLSAIHRAMRLAEILRAETETGRKSGQAKRPPVPMPGTYRLCNIILGVVVPTGTGRIGAAEMFVKSISTLREIELFQDDDEILQGSLCARIQSDDGLSHDVLSPLSGGIIQSNKELRTNLKILEYNPHVQGWLCRIIPPAMKYEVRILLPYSEGR